MDGVVPVHRRALLPVHACRMVPQRMFRPGGLDAPETPWGGLGSDSAARTRHLRYVAAAMLCRSFRKAADSIGEQTIDAQQGHCPTGGSPRGNPVRASRAG